MLDATLLAENVMEYCLCFADAFSFPRSPIAEAAWHNYLALAEASYGLMLTRSV